MKTEVLLDESIGK